MIMARFGFGIVAGALAWGMATAGALSQDEDVAPAAAETDAIAEMIAQTAEPAAIDWPVAEPVDVICPFDFDYESGAMSCGFISVPENRSDADSRMIRLLYVKIASTAENAEDVRADPVIYLTGGPGVVVEGYADRLREHDILAQRDLYILEQRGIANSGDFCPHYSATHRGLAWAETPAQQAINDAERMRACFQAAAAAGVDLTGYNTLENARDVRALRQALGFEDWNVWGISYGSHLGQMVLNEDADGTRAMVIDAIVPNDLSDLMRIGRWVTRLTDNVFETCADDPICDGLRPRFDAALEKMIANPVVIEVDDPERLPDGQVRIGGEILIFAPFMMMYEQDMHPAIPAVMDAIVTGIENDDMSMFELFANSDFGGGGSAQGMSSAIRCNDGYHAASAEVSPSDIAENPFLAGIGFSAESAAYTAQVCVDEGLMPRRDTADYALVQSDLPILVVNGAWDPVTPPPLAQIIMGGFSNGRYIEVPFAGHGPTRSMPECAGPVLNAFFDDPDPQALDATCLEAGVGEPDYVSLYGTSAIIRAGLMATDDPKTLAPVGLWVGLPVIMLLLAFFIYPLGWLARLIGRPSMSDLSAQTGGGRWLAWGAAITGLAFPALMGLGAYEASEISEIALLAGLSGTAGLGAWMAMLSGLLGLGALVQMVRSIAGGDGMRIGTMTGLAITGLSGLALMAFALAWDLGPF
jgi:pimeloyl-ACP methyl ester carboxylesterase